ncbi:MAG: hypothetical protein MH137_06325 [Flavobacteriales bacterium]|nr:hypothetical protein [Flavobacteriales bacterium]
METIKEFIDSLKERFSNPFLFSFLVSFLICNWEVTLTLLFRDIDQIQALGYETYYALIKSKVNFLSGLVFPILGALFYTFGFPFLRSGIQLFNSWLFKRTDKKNLEILEGSYIEINKYLTLRDDYTSKLKKLEEIINQEGVTFQKLIDEEKKNIELSKKVEEYETFRKQSNDLSILNGKWKNTFSSEKGMNGSEIAIIEDGKYYILERNYKNHVFDIENFYYDAASQKIFFVKMPKGLKAENMETSYLLIDNLKIYPDGSMQGHENYVLDIKYTKIDE